MRIMVEGLGASAGATDGAGRYFLGLVAGLGRRTDVRVTAVVGSSLQEAVRAVPGLEGSYVFPTRGRASRLIAQHLVVPLLARAKRFDAVIYSGNYAPVLPGPPGVTVVQNLLVALDRPEYGLARALYRNLSRRWLLRRAGAVVAISRTLANALSLHAPASARIEVVLPGVELDLFSKAAPRPPGGPSDYFLSVGTVWLYRDHSLALAALSQSELVHQLVIVGEASSGERERLEQEARRLGVAEQLRFAGVVGDLELLRDWYAGAAALLCTSQFEAFALAGCEAMAAGTPVIAVRRTVYPEVFTGAALFVDPCPASVAAGMREVLDESVRRRLREKGRRRAAQLSWDRCAEELIQLCRSLGPQTTAPGGDAE